MEADRREKSERGRKRKEQRSKGVLNRCSFFLFSKRKVKKRNNSDSSFFSNPDQGHRKKNCQKIGKVIGKVEEQEGARKEKDRMNFGQGFYTFMQTNLQPLVLCGIIGFGAYFMIERKFSKIAGLVVIGIIAIGFVFATTEVKDLFLNLFRQIFR